MFELRPTLQTRAVGSAVALFAALMLPGLTVLAQQKADEKSEPKPPSAAPADKPAAPTPPPSWQQGRSAEQEKSPLHPFAIHLTGKSAKELPVDKLKGPAGFKVEVWAEGAPGARSLALGDKDTVFVGTRQLKEVYAIVDRAGKREVKTLLKDLDSPNGVVFHKGTLYVAERNRITRYDGIENNLDNPPAAQVVIDNLDPNKAPGHFWKFLAMGPDGKLYFNIGAPGNIVMPTYQEASIMRVDPAKGTLETVALGVRNSVGFDFHPRTKQLWFTNHGRDWLGDESPHDTLHVVTRKGQHFGYPYCHQGDTLDPEFGKNRSCSEFSPPALKLGAHIAPIGMRFYTGKMFPAEYQNNIFIAMRGSWNRTIKQGYNITRVTFDADGKPKMVPFLTGFLVDDKADPPMWGRPNDLMVMRDGSLLVSDDQNGILYRVSYGKK
jgi:glucose/arabinose dehydrogenase